MVGVGEEAPDFTLQDQDGKPVTLSKLRGAPVVLYFYPKAETPGCTTQACGVRDHQGEYERLGVKVLGVSPDSVDRIKRFAGKHNLNFTLLSDENHEVAERYGVWVKKRMYGKEYFGVQRATFIIDGEGKVVHVIPNVKPATHDEEVLAALQLSSSGQQQAG